MKKILLFVMIGTFSVSCKPKAIYQEVKDKNLFVQAIQLDEPAANNESLSYKIRLVPEKQMLDSMTSGKNKDLIYHADSCFYISTNEGKKFPVLTQPVANGVKGTYEYLVEFEIDKNVNRDNMKLTYQDKYTNHKAYTLTSNPK